MGRERERERERDFEFFEVKMELRQWYVMSPCLFGVFFERRIKQATKKVAGDGGKLRDERGRRWEIKQVLYEYDTVLLADLICGYGSPVNRVIPCQRKYSLELSRLLGIRKSK